MRQRQARAAARHGQEAKEIADRLRSIQSRSGHNLHRIWSDWISSMALALANGVDHRPEVHARREAEYMQIVQRQGPEVMREHFPVMFALVAQNLEDNPNDLLGGIYMSLELGSDHAGQFFTPDCVSRAMARMHLTGVDIDSSVLRMAYVQLSLLGIPAFLHVGDSLRMEMRELYVTPVHFFNNWTERLQRRAAMDKLTQLFELVRQAGAETHEELTTGATTDEPPTQTTVAAESDRATETPDNAGSGQSQLGLFDFKL